MSKRVMRAPPKYEVMVRGGTLVDGAVGVWNSPTDIGIEGGKIAQIGGPMTARDVIEADGLLVVPGGIDMHVHLANQSGLGWRWVDDFTSGTKAAIAGGITTVGSMTSPEPGQSLLEALRRDDEIANARAVIDYTLHPIVVDVGERVIGELPLLASQGYSSIKTFTSVGSAFEEAHCRAIEVAGQSGLLTMVHCEDTAVIGIRERQLRASNRVGIEAYPDSRPPLSEASAISRALDIGWASAAPIYVVHLSSALGLESVRRARARGQAVFVESRPIYLHLQRDRYAEQEGARFVSFPPLREQADSSALWQAMANDEIQTHCSDHAPLDRRQILDPTLELGSFKGAMPGLETLMPLLFSEGVRTGRITHAQWVRLCSTNAARLFGMYPAKGSIGVGSDADLVIWDPNLSRTVSVAEMESNADFDVYEGRRVTGWPRVTVSRGEVVYRDGHVVGAPGRGKRVRRDPFDSAIRTLAGRGPSGSMLGHH